MMQKILLSVKLENFIECKISSLIMYKYFAKFSTHLRTQDEKANYLSFTNNNSFLFLLGITSAKYACFE